MMSNRHFSKALLPNLITLFNLFSGFLAIIMIMQERYFLAGGLISLSLLWDSLDGKISRLFKNPTAFGRELDSLSDIVSFIAAPSVFVTKVIFDPMTPWSLIAVFIFLGSGAYRLARFNIRTQMVASEHFEGLPTPAAGLSVAMYTLSCYQNQWIDTTVIPFITILFLIVLSFLMASQAIYPKLSGVKLSDWKPFFMYEAFLLAGTWVLFTPFTAFSSVFLLYVFFAPLYLKRLRKMERELHAEPESK